MTRTPRNPVRSIRALEPCARRHLEHYLDPTGSRAYWTYDCPSDPDELTPLDCLAPNLLSATTKDTIVVPMFQPSGASSELLAAMRAVLAVDTDVDFLQLDLVSDPAWQTVRDAMVASEPVKGVTAVGVSKVLHRKRPRLVPLYDRLVREYYFETLSGRGAPGHFWPALQADLVANRGWIDELRDTLQPEGGPELSTLRTADIIVWEHQVACT